MRKSRTIFAVLKIWHTGKYDCSHQGTRSFETLAKTLTANETITHTLPVTQGGVRNLTQVLDWKKEQDWAAEIVPRPDSGNAGRENEVAVAAGLGSGFEHQGPAVQTVTLPLRTYRYTCIFVFAC